MAHQADITLTSGQTIQVKVRFAPTGAHAGHHFYQCGSIVQHNPAHPAGSGNDGKIDLWFCEDDHALYVDRATQAGSNDSRTDVQGPQASRTSG